jgi:SIR2-like domain
VRDTGQIGQTEHVPYVLPAPVSPETLAYISKEALLQRFGISLISFTRFISSHVVNPTAFLSELHKLLYKNYDHTKNDPNMQMLATLATNDSFGPALETLITYNIDDIFERTVDGLSSSGPMRSVFSAQLYVEPVPGMKVIHPHGFLPFEATDLSQYTQVVLSETAYHTHYLHQYHWANMAQLQEFTHKVCLFIGLSFSDPNMRRLLDFSRTFVGRRHSHFAIKRAEVDNHYNYFFEKDMQIVGVKVLWIRDYAQIADLIRKIMTP